MMSFIRMYTTAPVLKILITIFTIILLLFNLIENLKESNTNIFWQILPLLALYIIMLSIILSLQGHFTKYREDLIEKNEEEFFSKIKSDTNKILEEEQHGNSRKKDR